MTDEKTGYEPTQDEIEALKKVVEESREGLGKLASEEAASEKRKKLKTLIRKIKERFGENKAETAEIEI